MKLKNIILIILLSLFISANLFSQSEEPSFKPEIYKARRVKLMELLDHNSIAVLRAADTKQRNGDVDYRFRQESNFLYLTGYNESPSVLLLAPDGMEINGQKVKEVIFVQESDPRSEQWTGKLPGTEGMKKNFGLEMALPVNTLKDILPAALKDKKILYTLFQRSDYVYEMFTDKKINLAEERKKFLSEKYPGMEFNYLFKPLNQMREIKSRDEINLIQKAIDATVEGYTDVLKVCKPGMYEYELQGIIEYAYTRNGCEYPGFTSIVGSGPNSCILHYDANRRKILNGEVVVMDIGGEYGGYSADLTRTIPINGKFSKEQKEIYNIVYQASEEIIKYIKPGISPRALDSIADAVVGKGLLKLGLIKSQNETGMFLPHGVSHDIGLDVHDVSSHGKLKAGQVITVEPGIYISEDFDKVDKKYLNIGIRIEDDVLVTETGHEVLTGKAPKRIEEIEKLMTK
jgi:Xaa-Pro aminopeptidase